MGKAKAYLDAEVEAKFVKAIKDRDAVAVDKLVATGIDVNAPLKSERDETPLELATRYGTNDVAVVLYKAGADWRQGGLNLLWSVYFKDEWLTRELIKAGADLNYKGRIMGRPLPLATEYNLPNLMRLLIDAGADVNTDCPLAGAVSRNQTEAALMLLAAGAMPSKEQSLLPWAAQHGNREVLLALIKAGAELNEKASLSAYNKETSKHEKYCEHATALIIAAGNGFEEVAKDLIDAGADLYATDAKGVTAMNAAQAKNHAKVVALLEAASARNPRKADPSADLIFAAEKGDLAQVKKLLAAGANPNVRDARPKSQGFTPLMLAAQAGHRDAVAALLEGGADPNLKDEREGGDDMGFNFIFNEGGIEHVLAAGYAMSRTALHWAIEKGHVEVSRLLMARAGDINGTDRVKMTPLHLAAEAGSGEIVRVLLKAGADPAAKARGKQMPLHYASDSGNVEIVRALLQAGAKPDLKNDDGHTPLLIAAGRAHPAVVAALLEAGANVHTVSRSGETPIARATGSQLFERKYRAKEMVVQFLRPESEILETVRILIAAGADPAMKDKYGRSADENAARHLKESKFFEGVIEVLKQAQPRPATPPAATPKKPKAAPPVKAAVKSAGPPKADKTSEDGAVPRPDFSDAAKSKKFVAALGELEQLCGTKRQPMHEVNGGFRFHVQTGKNLDLDKAQEEFLKKGAFVFSPDTNFASRIAVLPTTDKYDALLAMQTNGQNYDLMPQDVVAWLKKLEKEQPFVITGVGFDFVSGRFTTKIDKPAVIAKRMYDFCPDIVDQGTGDVKALAQELVKSNTVFFWWD